MTASGHAVSPPDLRDCASQLGSLSEFYRSLGTAATAVSEAAVDALADAHRQACRRIADGLAGVASYLAGRGTDGAPRCDWTRRLILADYFADEATRTRRDRYAALAEAIEVSAASGTSSSR